VIALAATLHDTTGALAPLARRALPALRRLYPGGIAVATSPPTSARMVTLLRDEGVWGGAPAANVRGPLYRLSLRRALGTEASRIHYLDFDRALHWVAGKPRELAAVLRAARRAPLLLLGRTEKAHRSHQRPLYATETVVNRLLADRLGWSGRVDFLAPSFVLGRDAARDLLRRSRFRDDRVYGEWAAIVATLAREVSYLECGGLDWETPDRHRRAVRRVGLAAWRARHETRKEWRMRIAMGEAIVSGFERTFSLPSAPIALIRLRQRAG
jgi:hypothetical protein